MMLSLRNICKKLGNFALTDINIDIQVGEYFVLLGRSGSGKTQLLELIAGLSIPDSGEVWINNQNATFRKIQDRQVGLVFQDYAIFPNMTVYGNIAYPLHCQKLKRKEIHEKVVRIAGEMNIPDLLDRFSDNLSGGELQRVALARTLVNHPKILLLDEPMASIDASLKEDIKRILRRLNRNGLTIIHVTHDFREAISLANRVGVIHNGSVIQAGTPDIVFSRPVNKFVARYAGIRNFFKVKFFSENGNWKAKSENNLVFKISGSNFPGDGLVILRSNDVKISSREPLSGNDNCFSGVIREINPSEYGMEILVDAGEIFYIDLPVSEFKLLQIKESSDVWIRFPNEAAIALPGKV
jgi:ABC-type Fe3+/spermidine/putrescine transport system ATPase subunit